MAVFEYTDIADLAKNTMEKTRLVFRLVQATKQAQQRALQLKTTENFSADELVKELESVAGAIRDVQQSLFDIRKIDRKDIRIKSLTDYLLSLDNQKRELTSRINAILSGQKETDNVITNAVKEAKPAPAANTGLVPPAIAKNVAAGAATKRSKIFAGGRLKPTITSQANGLIETLGQTAMRSANSIIKPTSKTSVLGVQSMAANAPTEPARELNTDTGFERKNSITFERQALRLARETFTRDREYQESKSKMDEESARAITKKLDDIIKAIKGIKLGVKVPGFKFPNIPGLPGLPDIDIDIDKKNRRDRRGRNRTGGRLGRVGGALAGGGVLGGLASIATKGLPGVLANQMFGNNENTTGLGAGAGAIAGGFLGPLGSIVGGYIGNDVEESMSEKGKEAQLKRVEDKINTQAESENKSGELGISGRVERLKNLFTGQTSLSDFFSDKDADAIIARKKSEAEAQTATPPKPIQNLSAIGALPGVPEEATTNVQAASPGAVIPPPVIAATPVSAVSNTPAAVTPVTPPIVNTNDPESTGAISRKNFPVFPSTSPLIPPEATGSFIRLGDETKPILAITTGSQATNDPQLSNTVRENDAEPDETKLDSYEEEKTPTVVPVPVTVPAPATATPLNVISNRSEAADQVQSSLGVNPNAQTFTPADFKAVAPLPPVPAQTVGQYINPNSVVSADEQMGVNQPEEVNVEVQPRGIVIINTDKLNLNGADINATLGSQDPSTSIANASGNMNNGLGGGSGGIGGGIGAGGGGGQTYSGSNAGVQASLGSRGRDSSGASGNSAPQVVQKSVTTSAFDNKPNMVLPEAAAGPGTTGGGISNPYGFGGLGTGGAAGPSMGSMGAVPSMSTTGTYKETVQPTFTPKGTTAKQVTTGAFDGSQTKNMGTVEGAEGTTGGGISNPYGFGGLGSGNLSTGSMGSLGAVEGLGVTGSYTQNMNPSGGVAQLGANPRLAGSRAKFIEELNNSPQLKDRAVKAMLAEGGSGRLQNNMEQLFNYADMRGMSIDKALNSGQFGPVNRGEVDAKTLSEKDRKLGYSAIDSVGQGSNNIGYRTDQGLLTDPGARKYMQDPEKYGYSNIKGNNFFYHGERGIKWAENQKTLDKEYAAKNPDAPTGNATTDPATPTAKADAVQQTLGQSAGVGTPSVIERQGQIAATRRMAIQDELKQRLQFAAEKTGVSVEVGSGGQPGIGEGGPRTGSTRHDHGGAADLKLYQTDPVTGQKRLLDMSNPADAKTMERFTTETVRAGATGVGAGPGYMGNSTLHIGGGSVASWGGAEFIKRSLDNGRADKEAGKAEFEQWKAQKAAAAAQVGTPPAGSEKNQPGTAGVDPNKPIYDPNKTFGTGFADTPKTPEAAPQAAVTPDTSVTMATPERASMFAGAVAPADIKQRTLGAQMRAYAAASKETPATPSTPAAITPQAPAPAETPTADTKGRQFGFGEQGFMNKPLGDKGYSGVDSKNAFGLSPSGTIIETNTSVPSPTKTNDSDMAEVQGPYDLKTMNNMSVWRNEKNKPTSWQQDPETLKWKARFNTETKAEMPSPSSKATAGSYATPASAETKSSASVPSVSSTTPSVSSVSQTEGSQRQSAAPPEPPPAPVAPPAPAPAAERPASQTSSESPSGVSKPVGGDDAPRLAQIPHRIDDLGLQVINTPDMN